MHQTTVEGFATAAAATATPVRPPGGGKGTRGSGKNQEGYPNREER